LTTHFDSPVQDPTSHDNLSGAISACVVWTHKWLAPSQSFFSF